ncbi:DNA endonuclease RBBP8 isoform X2 [Cynoglossus semilaevis]|uniref:DNA endonuclease RBBP8 isoform X2 n=1 Tax=Cynoglossus semilaevis TaxID=244447 RepID=UPI0007DC918C|nr:DNA endonuclease RBBP8 isoform X2 [Cynoglossus semilaevis]
MSNQELSIGSAKPAELFEELWKQLRQCHQETLQVLEAKVSNLKKDRCLDAQRLEVFYSRNQQLKEENKKLQEAVSHLEERLRARECDRCATLGEELKNKEDQHRSLITKMTNEKDDVEEENRKMHVELQKCKLTCSRSQQATATEQEEDFIPNSPVLPSSLPATNKLKKHRNVDKNRRLRYIEFPLPRPNNTLFREISEEPVDAAKDPGREEVLVPNTCVLDFTQTSDGNHEGEEVVAETCGLEPFVPVNNGTSELPSRSNNPKMNNIRAIPDLPTKTSPSLLYQDKRFSENGSIPRAKRKKEDSEQDDNEQRFQEVKSAQKRASVSFLSPAFKKTDVKNEDERTITERKRSPLQDVNMSHGQPDALQKRRLKVEQMWSIDPALALSMYEGDCTDEEQLEENNENVEDTDTTWVSHSMLQGRGLKALDRQNSLCGLGGKANDSLELMFDTTAHEEYKSYSCSDSFQSQSGAAAVNDNDDDEEEEEEEEDNDSEQISPGSFAGQRKAQEPTFAHVAVVRKKDERRKLKGTTCKECEIYYAHLPEEEKLRKLSECSRHRFRYIPPSTPENFWEVGFPSTQTCIERGYIREEKNPQLRSRRRQPFNALFSPKEDRHLEDG